MSRFPAARSNDYWNFVAPQYFETIGARLIEGRFFSRNDATGAPPVVVINQAMAHTYWPQESAIGHRVRLESGRTPGAWRTIVGVVADIKNAGLERATGTELYIPHLQTSTIPGITNNFVGSASLLIRTRSDPMSLMGAVRRQIHALDPTLPISNIRTMEDVMSAARSRPRFLTLLLATVSLVLAALGIYGVIGYLVAQRTSEIGIRMALGARASDVLRLIGSAGLRLALAGTAAGAAGAFALSKRAAVWRQLRGCGHLRRDGRDVDRSHAAGMLHSGAKGEQSGSAGGAEI